MKYSIFTIIVLSFLAGLIAGIFNVKMKVAPLVYQMNKWTSIETITNTDDEAVPSYQAYCTYGAGITYRMELNQYFRFQ